MAKKNKFKNDANSQEKLELAQKIAANSQRVAKTYASVENAFGSAFRWITSFLNNIFFNTKFSKLFALICAIILYVSVNANATDTIGISQSATFNDVPVKIIYNSEIYEISGIPETVNVIVSGDMSDITLQRGKTNSSVTADLSGLTEGSYNIKLAPTNFSSELAVNVLDTPSVTVTIKKKQTAKFNISYEFINRNRMDSMYNIGEPLFDTTEVLLRASQDTIESISFVKALIDVTDVTADFTKEAKILAYDNSGHIVDCDIIPATVTATVAVSTPSKTVPLIVRPHGTLVDTLAIDSITLDYDSTVIYGATNVLAGIDAIYIDLDVSKITKDTVFSTVLNIPAGVNKMDVTRVNLTVSTGEKVTKVIENVYTTYINLDSSSGLKMMPANEKDALANVVLTGTANNLEKITATDIKVQFDLAGVQVGTQSVPVLVSGDNPLVDYKLEDGRQYIDVVISE